MIESNQLDHLSCVFIITIFFLGTISDCWEVTERGAAFSFLFVGQFFGPLVGKVTTTSNVYSNNIFTCLLLQFIIIGPIIGGGLTTGLGWRSTFWFCVAYGLFLFCFLFVFLPETYRLDKDWETPEVDEKQQQQQQQDEQQDPQLQQRRSASHLSASEQISNIDTLRQETPDNDDQPLDLEASTKSSRRNSLSSTVAHGGLTQYDGEDNVDRHNGEDTHHSTSSGSSSSIANKSNKFNPLQSVLLLRHMFVFMIAVQTGICFGTMFTIETIIPDLYTQYYGFESWQTGK